MQRNLKTLFSFLKPHFSLHQQQQCRTAMSKVRLKWFKSKSLDSVIERDTYVKAAILLKDAIKRSPTNFISSQTFRDWKKPLGLTFPVLRFLRRYPTLFKEFPHPRFPSLICFRLTDIALLLDKQEQEIYNANELASVETLCRILMMFKSRKVFLNDLYPLRWDLGLPDDFLTRIVGKYPGYLRVEKMRNRSGCSSLSLVEWRDEFAVSALEKTGLTGDYTEFKKGKKILSFPLDFPRCYGDMKTVKAWMDEFQQLPYISPYEDCSGLDPRCDVMEKRIVGLLHEFLGLMIHKKTQRNYIKSFREELVLPHRFTPIFTRYPGIFYLSLKCQTTTVTLKEGYRKATLINPHPLAKLRRKVYHVMTSGLRYGNKAVNLKTPESMLDDAGNEEVEEDSESDEEEECWEGDSSDMSDDSDSD